MSINVIRKLATLAFIAVFASSCDDNLNNRYCEFTARFHVDNVTSYPVLATSCTSLGEFCTITLPINGGGKVYVSNYKQTSYIESTVLQKYTGGLQLGLGGLVIGKPSTPEMLEDESQVTCYDLCCPNCYYNFNIQKQMTLGKNNDTLVCPTCSRTYDLNNMGIVSQGEAGHALFRYSVTYYQASCALTVYNR